MPTGNKRRERTDRELERIARSLSRGEFVRLVAMYQGGIGQRVVLAEIARDANRRSGPHKTKLGSSPAEIREAHSRIVTLYVHVLDFVEGDNGTMARHLLSKRKLFRWPAKATLRHVVETIRAAQRGREDWRRPEVPTRRIVAALERTYFSGANLTDRHLQELTRRRELA